MERGTWTDGRLDDKMQGIDHSFDRIGDEIAGLRTDMRAEMRGLREDFAREMGAMRSELKDEMAGMRGDINGLRTEFAGLQRQLIQIGFGLVGALLAVLCALIVATV